MLKRFVITACACLVFGVSQMSAIPAAAADLKVGVMNVQKVLTSCSAGKAAKAKFDERMKELQAKFKLEEEELTAMQKDIEKKSTAWSEETKQEKIREFQRRRREAQAKAEDARFEMKGLQEKELAPILKTLEEVVGKYGESNAYTMILDSKSGVVYFPASIDITDKLVVELDAAMAAAK